MSWWQKVFGEKTQAQQKRVASQTRENKETITLAGRTAWDEVRSLQSMAVKQAQLLAKLSPITKDLAMGFFRGLGVPRPNEYQGAIDAFGSFRSFGLTSEGSTVHTWFLQLRPRGEGSEALYIHVDDPVIPIGLAICKLTSGSYLGYYTTGTKFKDKLGL